MFIVIDLMGDGDTVIEAEDASRAKAKLEADEVKKREAYFEYLKYAPQPQVVPVEH